MAIYEEERRWTLAWELIFIPWKVCALLNTFLTLHFCGPVRIFIGGGFYVLIYFLKIRRSSICVCGKGEVVRKSWYFRLFLSLLARLWDRWGAIRGKMHFYWKIGKSEVQTLCSADREFSWVLKKKYFLKRITFLQKGIYLFITVMEGFHANFLHDYTVILRRDGNERILLYYCCTTKSFHMNTYYYTKKFYQKPL